MSVAFCRPEAGGREEREERDSKRQGVARVQRAFVRCEKERRPVNLSGG